MSEQQIIKYTIDNIHDKNWLTRMIPMAQSTSKPWNLIVKEYHIKDISFLLEILSKKRDLSIVFNYYLNELLGTNNIIIEFFIEKGWIVSIKNKDYPVESYLKNINGKAIIDSQTKLYVVNVVNVVNLKPKKEPKEPKEPKEQIEEPKESQNSEVEMDYFTALFDFFHENNEIFPLSKEIEIAETEEEKVQLFEQAIEMLTDIQTEMLAEFEEIVNFSESETESEN